MHGARGRDLDYHVKAHALLVTPFLLKRTDISLNHMIAQGNPVKRMRPR
jgi:hypothetical protein